VTLKTTPLQTKIVIPKMKSQISSPLPDGLFTYFQGMQNRGTFDYKLILINKKQTRPTRFDSNLKRKIKNNEI
jgi:hypothetical protein